MAPGGQFSWFSWQKPAPGGQFPRHSWQKPTPGGQFSRFSWQKTGSKGTVLAVFLVKTGSRGRFPRHSWQKPAPRGRQGDRSIGFPSKTGAKGTDLSGNPAKKSIFSKFAGLEKQNIIYFFKKSFRNPSDLKKNENSRVHASTIDQIILKLFHYAPAYFVKKTKLAGCSK